MSSQFESAVKLFSSNPTEVNMAHLAQVAASANPSAEEVAFLAEILANSGHRFTQYPSSSDIPSTGGPSSLSTLICPLYLRLNGFKILKITVPGRPAGGIDVLAQIPGYKVALTQTEIIEALKHSGYVHVLADERFAPLDALLFSFRKKSGFIAIPSLVIASILSKKLAAGVKYVGLDIRVGPHGNFGNTIEDANINAIKFIKVSSELGIKSCCFLTDGRIPFQPFIGRGESLLALHYIFEDQEHVGLRDHIKQCENMAKIVSNMAGLEYKSYNLVDLYQTFKNNLISQGTHYDFFTKQVDMIKDAKRYDLLAESDGYPIIDMQKLRAIITEYQNHFLPDNINMIFPDPCGLELCYTTGTAIISGGVLAKVRCDAATWTTLKKRLLKCFVMSNSQPATPFFKVINDG